MNNLIEQAAIWLRSKECLEGTIFSRTRLLLNNFRSYIKSNQAELEVVTGERYSVLADHVNQCWMMVESLLTSYLRGNHSSAYDKIYGFIADMSMSPLDKGTRFYKGREPESHFLFSKDKMFHIPFDKRSKVGNQRFSISGTPCLYLGGSSYICWEELNRVDFSSCNFCGYLNKVTISLFDLALPPSIRSLEDIRRVSLILACSLKADRNALFKEEYILPQSILLALIKRTLYSHKLFGVRYISSHFLDGDADFFQCDYNEPIWISRYYNYVFPAAASLHNGYNESLRDLFIQTETTAMERESLLKPERLVSGDSNEAYLDSQFGLMDAIIDERLGVRSLRRETALVKRSTV